MAYCIKNTKTNLFVSYLEGTTCECWTHAREDANTYTLIQAVVERMFIANICELSKNDLVIERI